MDSNEDGWQRKWKEEMGNKAALTLNYEKSRQEVRSLQKGNAFLENERTEVSNITQEVSVLTQRTVPSKRQASSGIPHRTFNTSHKDVENAHFRDSGVEQEAPEALHLIDLCPQPVDPEMECKRATCNSGQLQYLGSELRCTTKPIGVEPRAALAEIEGAGKRQSRLEPELEEVQRDITEAPKAPSIREMELITKYLGLLQGLFEWDQGPAYSNELLKLIWEAVRSEYYAKVDTQDELKQEVTKFQARI